MLEVSSAIRLEIPNYFKFQFLICKMCMLFLFSLPLFIENFSEKQLILLATISAGAWK